MFVVTIKFRNTLIIVIIHETSLINHVNHILCYVKVRNMHAKLPQSCPTLCNSMDCSPPGPSVQWIL